MSASGGLLLIDLDDTLIDRQAGFQLWATRFLRSLGRDTPDELAWVVELDGTGLTPREELFAGIRDRYGLADEVPAMMDAYHEAFPSLIPQPPADTYAALAEARAVGWKICIVTNGGPRAQVPKISPELAAAVDGWVISETVGVGNPTPGSSTRPRPRSGRV